jgi:hypothetical protein
VTSAKHKKYLISQLEIDGQITQEASDIQSHVFQFYKTLFNLETERGSLMADIWEEHEKTSVEDK